MNSVSVVLLFSVSVHNQSLSLFTDQSIFTFKFLLPVWFMTCIYLTINEIFIIYLVINMHRLFRYFFDVWYIKG